MASILIDWGTSTIRAYRLDGAGSVSERRRLARGLASYSGPRDFRASFDELTAGWRPAPVLLSGMVGSRQGWVEAAYAACPARLADLAGALTPVPGVADAHIVPGLATVAASGAPDVLRGEEVQVFGAQQHAGQSESAAGATDALVCLPGTHSKWVRVADGAIAGFATAMTGEVFATLRQYSLLAATTIDGEIEPGAHAFAEGLAWAGRPGGLLHHLFAARTRPLREGMDAAAASAFLSGLLIGHEVAALAGDASEVILVGDPALCRLYEVALAARGAATVTVTVDAEQATVAGLTALAALL
ncbi:MAG: 2-dehydro-3-deoxygalactonokinase [Alphaproteobacteria bacterium]